jgi:hypothetical protein
MSPAPLRKQADFQPSARSGSFVCQFIRQPFGQWFGNGVLTAQPFAQVNQFAAFGVKRPVFSCKLITLFPAGRTNDFYAPFIGGSR